MPIEYAFGNLFQSSAEALVNPVNCVGVMGKGLALQFKERFPNNFDIYKDVCDRNGLRLGQVLVCDYSSKRVAATSWGDVIPCGDGTRVLPRCIINFPTKGHWRDKSELRHIEAGLVSLAQCIKDEGIHSIAVPSLGCGLGGLNWYDVRPLIERELGGLDARVLLYVPEGVKAKDQPKGTLLYTTTRGGERILTFSDGKGGTYREVKDSDEG